jgi:hypothetical protein
VFEATENVVAIQRFSSSPSGVSGGANVHQSWRFENDQAGELLWSGRVSA